MNSVIASIKINQRLNKISSSDYRNVKDWQKEEAVNKAVIDWFRRNKQGVNIRKERDENTIDKTDDFQHLLKEQELSVGKRDRYIETYKFPKDYLYYKRVTPITSKGTCLGVQIKSSLIEEGNVDDYLVNYDTQPSFDFEETFHTLTGNRVRVYHNNDFSVDKVVLTYYRKPAYINFVKKIFIEQEWEWKEDEAEQIIDEACKILAGDFKDLNTFEIAKQRVEEKD